MPVEVEIDKRTTLARVGQSLFECAEQMDVQIPTSCIKNGKCRECLVEVSEGGELLSPISPEEEHLQGRFRLSCRATISVNSGRISCHTLRREKMRIEQEARHLPTSFQDTPLNPAVTRRGKSVLLDGKSIAQGGAIYGVALDVGTTTVAVRLIDLESGDLVAASAFENPQRFAGSNVMSRILFNSENKGRLQQRTLTGYLTHALEDFPVDTTQIYEMVVVGNTTMRDLFFGLDVSGIGQKPFRSITEVQLRNGERASTAVASTGRRLRLPIHPDARVVGLPIISSHVGADAAACLLSVDLARREEPMLLMDIGTNTEILCGCRDQLLVASCPAGPAFEGGAVSCGMPGLKGAIERVAISATGESDYRVIDDGPAEGICGSGLIDLLNELVMQQMIDANGRYVDGEDRFFLDRSADIYLSEADIAELAQAKGANSAGIKIVLDRAGLTIDQVDRLYLAGGFARYLDTRAARGIGMIPDIADGCIRQIGNAALEGASIALCSLPHRDLLDSLVRRAEHLELEMDEHFFDYYVDGCLFAGVN
jgi:uncharacterized 2Fe-2S/4Fe-4S cluster protein (DUF4445 family)